MRTVLDTGDTWFLESFSQGPYGSLVIRVSEGRTSSNPQDVNLPGLHLGQAHAVATSHELRVVEITFQDPMAFFTRREEFDSADPAFEFEEPDTYIRVLKQSSLQSFARSSTGVYSTWREGIREYHVWTEDQIFQVFSTEPPTVLLTTDSPDLSVERSDTWVVKSAS